MREVRTAKLAADWIERFGYEVSRDVGTTGVVGVLRNGAGPTIMLRADMDALPVTEATALPYASTVTAPDDNGTTVGVSRPGRASARPQAQLRESRVGTQKSRNRIAMDLSEGMSRSEIQPSDSVPYPSLKSDQQRLLAAIRSDHGL